MNIFNYKGQYIAEYALIISIILAALIAMQTYVKRGLQGRYRDATDGLIAALGEAKGYEPDYNESEIKTEVTQNRTETTNLGGSVVITIDNATTVLPIDSQEGILSYRKILPAEAD